MDLEDMPAPIRDIMRAAYGDAMAQIFLISAIIGLAAVIAILFIKEQPLRRTVDIRSEPAERGTDGCLNGTGTSDAGPNVDASAEMSAAHTSATGIVDRDREYF
jgi:hypothetical protein